MRVIAGSARGVPLSAPRGSSTRPITDRVKETLFGILGDRVPDARMLDLYAGSGAIGIEALSRGAGAVDFVERDRAALATLRSNLERTRLGAAAHVHAVDVDAYLARGDGGPWDLAVADPPYDARAIVTPLRAAADRLTPGGMLVLKHFWRVEPPAIERASVVRQRRFGETMLTFWEVEEA
jgi:16S rRNA (guanine966-N2)-methyltransferase